MLEKYLVNNMAYSGKLKARSSSTFAESSPKVLKEIRKKEFQLQKEFDLIEKQSRTNRNLLANHEQVLKKSWRRLEKSKLKDELTPLMSRRDKDTETPERTRRLMFSNRTAIGMEKFPGSASLDDDGLTSSSSLPQLPQEKTKAIGHNLSSDSRSRLLPPIVKGNHPSSSSSSSSSLQANALPKIGTNSTADKKGGLGYKSMQRSPYISSPYAFRRPLQDGPPKYGEHHSAIASYRGSSSGNTSSHPLMKTTSTDDQKQTNSGSNLPSTNESMDDAWKLNLDDGKMNLLTVLSTKKLKKDDLLKLSKFLEYGNSFGDTGPEDFKKFYELSAPLKSENKELEQLAADLLELAQPLPQLPSNELNSMNEGDVTKSPSTDEEKEQVETVKDEVRNAYDH